MQSPLEVAFKDVEHSDAVEARVREEAKKLEQLCGRITSMRVVITRPHRRHHKGDTYAVRIHAALPGGADVNVDRDPSPSGRHEDVYATVRDAFDAAKRQLQDIQRKRQD